MVATKKRRALLCEGCGLQLGPGGFHQLKDNVWKDDTDVLCHRCFALRKLNADTQERSEGRPTLAELGLVAFVAAALVGIAVLA